MVASSHVMAKRRKLQVKIIAAVVLGAAVLVLALLYRSSFSTEAALARVRERWNQLQEFGGPEDARVLSETTDGGAHYYGIDAHKTIILEITGMELRGAKDQLRRFYTDKLKAWRPGFSASGMSGDYATVHGRAGLAITTFELFWYGDAANNKYRGPGAKLALAAYKPKDGRGHRFAAVTIFLCTRE